FRDVTTGEDGRAVLTDLGVGWHVITEVRAPEGFILSTEPVNVYLRPGESREVTIYNRARPSLTIEKICSVTATPLQHARFRIERLTDTATILVGEFTTDADGRIHIENVEPGRFRATEVSPPAGFVMDRNIHEFTIAEGQRFVLVVTNTPRAPIFIRKIDPQGNPLLGAEFVVTTMNGAHVATVQSAHTGYAIVPNVLPGWYIVREVRSPEGHILSNTPQMVEVFEGRPATVTFVNHRYPILQILKVDDSDNRPLIGAAFRITEANGRFVGEHVTDASRLITLTDLAPGVFIVSEIRSPDGYILDTTPQTVELRAGQTVQLMFRNTARPGLQLIKLCSATLRPVEGAVFDVTQLSGGFRRSLGTFTTAANGLFFIPDLEPGHYIITEVRAAPGFILDRTPQTVFVEGGRINVVQVYNTPYSNLRLLKICSESREPLPDAVFRLFDERRREIGTFTTSALGEIYLNNLPSGTYFLQEVRAPAGYLLDTTVRQIELEAGQLTTIEWPNTPLGSLRVIKRCYHTSEPLYGVEFELLDNRNNILGRFVTDRDGVISFGRNLAPGRYFLRETRPAPGYLLDERRHSITIPADGSTVELVVYNQLMRGRIQITKVSSGFNNLTKDRDGAPLSGATFEIFNNQMELVDTITTEGRQGIATSEFLPLGVYGIIEVSSPDYFITDGEMFFAEIKVHNDLIRFRVLNDPVELDVSVEKSGISEVQAGSIMYYEFRDIRNNSNVPLREFYLRDILPTEAVRLETIWTGVWSERVTMELQVRTNLSPNLRTVRRGLLSTVNNEIDVTRPALGLAAGEYVTEFRLVFGDDRAGLAVQPGFHETTGPRLRVRVLDNLEHGSRFTNRVDVGGRYLDKWVYDIDGWTTTVWGRDRIPLPRTGL
ncbi:MAG: SpaA isopeptide-forming pilin-related protein, partial [Oscillospiraceae bacterium]|nr:SpaA isopeptide-forming pilin-related protein [Oscillospiraceae bacterium]